MCVFANHTFYFDIIFIVDKFDRFLKFVNVRLLRPNELKSQDWQVLDGPVENVTKCQSWPFLIIGQYHMLSMMTKKTHPPVFWTPILILDTLKFHNLP